MGIQYFNRGGYRLRRHPPLKILDAHPIIMTPSKIGKTKIYFSFNSLNDCHENPPNILLDRGLNVWQVLLLTWLHKRFKIYRKFT